MTFTFVDKRVGTWGDHIEVYEDDELIGQIYSEPQWEPDGPSHSWFEGTEPPLTFNADDCRQLEAKLDEIDEEFNKLLTDV